MEVTIFTNEKGKPVITVEGGQTDSPEAVADAYLEAQETLEGR